MFLYSIIIFLPLLSFIILGYYCTSNNRLICSLIACFLITISTILSFYALLNLIFYKSNTLNIKILNWITSGNLHINWELYIDTLTIIMITMITFISTLVHFYSIGYMHKDPSYIRFFSYISLFTFMMLMLVTSGNLVQMFFSWEGVGIVSYLLIGFWSKKDSANAAAIKSLIVNRIGDVGFIIGILSIFFVFKTLNFDILFERIIFNNLEEKIKFFSFFISQKDTIKIISFFLFLAAMSKSAQFLFHVWLPDAMEGPTPVSALIHSATMVTAGVFMIVRMSPLFEYSDYIMQLIIIVGSITALFASTVAIVQNDIKRIIAYSTCAQLGYMFVAVGIGAYGIGMFHLFTHAFFKALLFLGSGSIIHALSGEQDIRNMGNLRKYIPITYIAMLIGTLSLTGFGIPITFIGTSGFLSKDAILEATFMYNNPISIYIFCLLIFSSFLTSLYSWRLMFKVFHGKLKITPDIMYQVKESPLIMLIPLILLAFAAIFIGIIFYPYFCGSLYKDFWKSSLFFSHNNSTMEFHHVPVLIQCMPFFSMILGISLAFFLYILKYNIAKKIINMFPNIYNFLLEKWYFDIIYNRIFIKNTIFIGNFLFKIIDVNIIDKFGPNGIAKKVKFLSKNIVHIQTGYVYHYAVAIIIGITVLISFVIFRNLL